MVTLTAITLTLVVAVVLGTTAALLAWRERPAPGSVPLVALLAGQSWWSVALAFQLDAGGLGAKAFWSDVAWVGTVTVPVAWLSFALEYTGRDRYVQPRYLAALCFVPAVTLALVATDGVHGLMYAGSELAVVAGTVTLERTPGPWLWVATAYSYAAILLGAAALLSLVHSESVQFRGQGVALLIGTLIPVAGNVGYLLVPRSLLSFDPTPVAFAFSGVAYLSAIGRFRLLDARPTPNQRARRLAFDRMHQAAAVVDDNGNVVNVNRRAADLLEVDRRAALGAPAAEVLPEYERLPAATETEGVALRREDGTTQYDVSVTVIRDARDRVIGRVITYHDLSEYLRQQQRLEVLNRTLRHNLRTETNLIAGYSDLAETEGNAEALAVVRESARRVARISEKSRDVVDLFRRAYDGAPSVPLADAVEAALSTVREDHPAVTIDHDPPATDARVDPAVEPVVANAVENAAEHNDPTELTVTVSAAVDGETVRLTVADDGDGLSAHERAAVDAGTETPLQHASGIGLWLIKWGADIAGGRAEFRERSPTGTVVEVAVPRRDAVGDDRESFPPSVGGPGAYEASDRW